MWADFSTWVDNLPDKTLSRQAYLKNKRLRSKQRQAQRIRLRERDGDRCHWCGIELDFELNGNLKMEVKHMPRRFPTIDHVVQVADEGGNEDSNCVLSCPSCNNRRSSSGKFRRR